MIRRVNIRTVSIVLKMVQQRLAKHASMVFFTPIQQQTHQAASQPVPIIQP